MIGSFVCLLSIVALSACGGGSSSASDSGPYFDMETLAKGIEESLTEKNPVLSAGTKIRCIQTGKQTAECHADRYNEQATSIEVSISADGKSFITH
jgi:hypothetical protein